MRKKVVARRYAQALIEVGKEFKAFENYGRQLEDVVGVFRRDPSLYKIVLNPMHKLEQRTAVVEKICERLGASSEIKRFLRILVEGRNIRLIEDIAIIYSRLLDEISGRIRVEVQSPFTLDDKTMSGIKAKLEGETKKSVMLAFTKKPELIGGVVIKIGNRIFDGSIRTQIEKVREKLLEGAI